MIVLGHPSFRILEAHTALSRIILSSWQYFELGKLFTVFLHLSPPPAYSRYNLSLLGRGRGTVLSYNHIERKIRLGKGTMRWN